jgi:hypothetical protein
VQAWGLKMERETGWGWEGCWVMDWGTLCQDLGLGLGLGLGWGCSFRFCAAGTNVGAARMRNRADAVGAESTCCYAMLLLLVTLEISTFAYIHACTMTDADHMLPACCYDHQHCAASHR